MSMVDITGKPSVFREATAEGIIILKPETLRKIREKQVEKGDVIESAKIAAVMAAKKTPQILPYTHPLPITGVETSITFREPDILKVTVTVRTHYKTGVEMEALTAVTAALLTVWDMVKKYEKDEGGQYPSTRITDIRVTSKVKREGD